MSKRDDRLATESADAKITRAVAIFRREWLEAHPDPADSPGDWNQQHADAVGLDSPLRRPMTREEQEHMRHPGGKERPEDVASRAFDKRRPSK